MFGEIPTDAGDVLNVTGKNGERRMNNWRQSDGVHVTPLLNSYTWKHAPLAHVQMQEWRSRQ